MTFLPIVERELRVAARRRGTYRARTGVALAGILLGVASYVATLISPAAKLGQLLFWSLSGMAMLYCLSAGRLLTTDCLSEEKREGTFGLLFLTDLKGYDVVLGKLAANSFSGFYGLLAMVPILAMTLLLGGTTYAEFGRMVLVLVNTFFLTLAIGVFVSACAREYREATGRYLFILLTLIILSPVCMFAIENFLHPKNNALLYVALPCPLFPFVAAFESNYHDPSQANPSAQTAFWLSVAILHALGWLLIFLACRLAPHSWQDEPSAPRGESSVRRKRWQWWREGGPEKRASFRKRSLDANAYYWLAARPYVKPAWVWTLLALVGLWCARVTLSIGWLDEATCVAAAYLVNTTLKLWIALEAGQQLAADLKSGAFELMLCTPLTARDVLAGQYRALRRQFLKPLLTVACVELIFMIVLLPHKDRAGVVCTWTAGIIMLAADAVAVSLVSMSRALTSRSHAKAMVAVIGELLIAPWIGLGLICTVTSVWMTLSLPYPMDWSPSWKFGVGWWFTFGIGIDLLLGWRAWRRLRLDFRLLASAAFSPKAARDGPARRRRARLVDAVTSTPLSWTRRKKLTAAFTAASVFVVGAAYSLFCPTARTVPQPLIVTINRTNTTLRVFPRWGSVVFLLPDGALRCWGRISDSAPARLATPQRMGSISDWVDVSFSQGNFVGVRADGTAWQSDWPPGNSEPRQVDPKHDWATATAGGRHSILRKKDGTLWAWGKNNIGQLGIGEIRLNSLSERTNLVEIGTNNDWNTVLTWGDSNFALRRNGTLWTWGYIGIFNAPGRFTHTNSFHPVQVCAETNWIELTPLGARNSAGELWTYTRLLQYPSETNPVSTTCQILVSNLTDATPVMGISTKDANSLALYSVRSNGTLWAQPLDWQGWGAPSTAGPWERFGKRSDWIAVWGGSGQTIALSADGTLWTWGSDFSQEPSLPFKGRLQALKNNLAGRFGSVTTRTPSPDFPQLTEPRALMRLVPVDRKQ